MSINPIESKLSEEVSSEVSSVVLAVEDSSAQASDRLTRLAQETLAEGRAHSDGETLSLRESTRAWSSDDSSDDEDSEQMSRLDLQRNCLAVELLMSLILGVPSQFTGPDCTMIGFIPFPNLGSMEECEEECAIHIIRRSEEVSRTADGEEAIVRDVFESVNGEVIRDEHTEEPKAPRAAEAAPLASVIAADFALVDDAHVA